MNKRYMFFVSRFLFLVCGMVATSLVFGQREAITADTPEMADMMRSNGKIYVVVTVCLIILTGLFIYAMSIDRKISRIEKNKE
jgi:hypothetical protein